MEPKTTHRIHTGLEMQAEFTLLVATPYLSKISFDFRVQVDFCPVHPVSHSDECDVIPILIGSYSSCQRHYLELVLIAWTLHSRPWHLGSFVSFSHTFLVEYIFTNT